MAQQKVVAGREAVMGGLADAVPRFVYSACAVGVAAVLTSPAMEASWAASCLPIIGGHNDSAPTGAVIWPTAADPVLRFSSAETKVTGRPGPGPGQHKTTIRKTVKDLNILNRVTASLIDVEIVCIYTLKGTPSTDKQRDSVDVSLVLHAPFNINIQGVTLPPITLNTQIPRDAGDDFKNFQKGSIDTYRPGNQNFRHEHGENGKGGHKQGVIFTALAEPIKSAAVPNGFIYEERSHGRVDLPGNLGHVFVGEWRGEPYHQSFTMLRVVLNGANDFNTPRGTFSGEIVIDGDPNGREYP
jgi:hypothetical protein